MTTAVQISRLTGYLDGLSPLLSMSTSAISESGSGLGTVLSKFGLGPLRGLKNPQVLVKGADFGPRAVPRGPAEVPGYPAAVQIRGVRKPNLDKPGL